MSAGIRTRVLLGAQQILRAPEVSVEFQRHAPLSRASIVLPDAGGEQFRTAAEGDAVEIHYGYRDQAATVWAGTVSWVKHGTKDQVTVGAVGAPEKLLSTTRITQSWMHEAPESIIKWATGRTGIPVGRIDSPGVVFPRFLASNIPVSQVARQCEITCQRAFGLDMSRWALWVDAGGRLNWGDFDEDGPMPSIATAAGLISHLPAGDAGGLNRVETFLLPGLRDAMAFHLTDTRRGIDGSFRAQRVVHRIRAGSARTLIWYHLEGKEYGGC